MLKFINRILLFIVAFLLSSIINKLYIDSLLEVFAIMSFVAYIANRVALALLIYFLIDMMIIDRNFKLKNIVNKLFLIYFIWLIGLLFGRFSNLADYNVDEHFNFQTFIPKWLNHLDNKLVRYYLLGNLLVYIPFGMFLRFHKSLIYSLMYFILIILLLETLQGVTNLGFFDIDDILLNGISGFIGILVMNIGIFLFKKEKIK